VPEPVRLYLRNPAGAPLTAIRVDWKLPVAPVKMPVPPVIVLPAMVVVAVMVVPFASVNVMVLALSDNSPWHGPKGGIVPVKFAGVNIRPPMPSDTPCTVPPRFKLKETVPAAAGATLSIPARIPAIARRTVLDMQAVYQSAVAVNAFDGRTTRCTRAR
jgi:hypothetical protein